MRGHISGAINLPLFSDEERSCVGTCYKVEGKEAAILMGLDFVGPKMSDYIRQAMALAGEREILVHCWRGGMRSESMAMLFSYAGLKPFILQGGYKAYRQYILDFFDTQPYVFRLIGGETGAGKTEILHALAGMGEQVLDLEGLAHHKGSAFGAIGQAPQPSTEQFENTLFHILAKMDVQRPIWVEGESRMIGSIFIPDGIWGKMGAAEFFHIQVPKEERIARLLRDYAQFPAEQLLHSLSKIAKRIGGAAHQQCISALEAKNYTQATEIVLEYYDKTYNFGIAKREPQVLHILPMGGLSPTEMAKQLLERQ
jgi:tRNA 2-selenouridine synthase